MSIRRQQLIKNINRLLSMFIDELALDNGASYFDSNISSEYFFIEILNVIYDLNLEDINQLKKNYPAIDLVDKSRKTSFQVTSQSDRKKIRTTIEKFKRYRLHEHYTNLKFLILSKSSTSFSIVDTDFDVEVIDLSKLGKKIRSLDSSKIESLHSYMIKELDYTNVIEPSSKLFALRPLQDSEINATNFFIYWKINDEKERDGYIEDFKLLRRVIHELNENQREFFWFIVEKSYSDRLESSLILHPQEIMNIAQYQGIIDSLVLRKLLHDDKEPIPMLVPHFLTPNSIDLDIIYLIKFSSDYLNLRKIIIDCNFSNV
ncbi:SMEK domain-containing protein [Psychrobacter sp. B38]|uniref:SMEK domain-containing protein n=1 Tax=Psychrobacter sp. B38 TaxID=3143538 RepID=UPI00320EB959